MGALCERLEADRKPDTVRIVAIHHPLTDPPRSISRWVPLRLNDRESVAQRLLDAGAEVVLAGHVHVAFGKRTQAGRPLHFVSGTGCQMLSEEPCCFLVLDVYVEGGRHGFDVRKYELGRDRQFTEALFDAVD
ncbi:MAG: hypothetical protein HY235_03175 [Acidobacteria bacterium]|nr:hypothetical protein [Acidobacteriota bacterium]